MKNGSNFNKDKTISNLSGCRFSKISLNIESRKKDLVKTVIENQAILKRIQDKRSVYNVRKWGQDRVKVEKNICNIMEYQYKDFKPTKSVFKLGIWSETQQLSNIIN